MRQAAHVLSLRSCLLLGLSFSSSQTARSMTSSALWKGPGVPGVAIKLHATASGSLSGLGRVFSPSPLPWQPASTQPTRSFCTSASRRTSGGGQSNEEGDVASPLVPPPPPTPKPATETTTTEGAAPKPRRRRTSVAKQSIDDSLPDQVPQTTPAPSGKRASKRRSTPASKSAKKAATPEASTQAASAAPAASPFAATQLLQPVNLAADDPPKTSAAWSTRLWVVFSDLHVSKSTLDITLQVLERVRQEAVARKAGVLFLGDFWDERGDLPVEPLNCVLRELSIWRQAGIPTLMLVGNHDQVNLGGETHSLEPLSAASEAVHVFTRPTLFRKALWLPYRREQEKLQEALQAAVTQAQDQPPFTAVFAHADIASARMNYSFQAKAGLPTSLFPEGVPVYTGHYHLPQTVPNTSIVYVGSQYQVSLNEAGERKRLLVLDAEQGWRQVEEIPVDIGPRHFKVWGTRLRMLAPGPDGLPPSPEQSAQVVSSESEVGSLTWTSLDVSTLRPRDRVKLQLQQEEMGSEAAQEVIRAMQAQGATVELRTARKKAAPRLQLASTADVEQLSPLTLLEQYAQHVKLGDGARAVAEEAVRALEESRGRGGAAPSFVDLALEEVAVEGYGPFRGRQTYRLGDRGVRVITGRNEDDTGASSNGAGKSSLVSAPLWALTGQLLSRFEARGARSTGPVDTMLNDDSAEARVELRGRVNGQAFVVERAVRKGKTSKLKVKLDGEDATFGTVPDTQEFLNSTFATKLLRHAVFFGQNDITALLESGDRELKELLQEVCEMDLWEEARKQVVIPKRKEAKEGLERASERAKLLEEQQAQAAAQIRELEEREEEEAQKREALLAALARQAAEERAALNSRVFALLPAAPHVLSRSLDILTAYAQSLQAALQHLQQVPPSSTQQEGHGLLSDGLMAAKQKVDNIKGVFSNLFSGKDSHQHPQHTPEGDAAVEQSLGTTSAPSQQLPSGSGASGIDLQAARAKLQQLREAVHQAQAVLTQAETELGVAQHDAQQSGAAVFDWVLGLLKEPSDISLRLDGAEASAAVVGRDVSSSNGRSGGSVMVADRPSSTSAPSQLPGSIDALVEWAQTEFMCDRLRPECDKCGQEVDVDHFMGRLQELIDEAHAKAGSVGSAQAKVDQAQAALTAAQASAAAQEEVIQGEQARLDALRKEQTKAHRAEVERLTALRAAAEREASEARAAAEKANQILTKRILGLKDALTHVEAAQARVTAVLTGIQQASGYTAAGTSSNLSGVSKVPPPSSDWHTVVKVLQRDGAQLWSQQSQSQPGLVEWPTRQWEGPSSLGESPVFGRHSGAIKQLLFSDTAAAQLGTLDPGKDWETVQRLAGDAAHAAAAFAQAAEQGKADVGKSLQELQLIVFRHQQLAAAGSTQAPMLQLLREQVAARQALLESLQVEVSELTSRISDLDEAERALGRGGVQSFVLEGVLGELESLTGQFMSGLTDGLVLDISATKPVKQGTGTSLLPASSAAQSDGSGDDSPPAPAAAPAKKGGRRGSRKTAAASSAAAGVGVAAAGGDVKEEITLTVQYQPADGRPPRPRSLAQLSGGERRRIAIALSLGFAQLVRQRARLSCNLLVLDEVLQQLDGEGCQRVASVLRDLPHESVLVVGQADSYVTAAFDVVDTVVKSNGSSWIDAAP